MPNPTLPALLAACILLTGCATGTQSTTNPLDAQAKKFQPAAGKASLYINRDGDVGSSITTLQVVLDGHNIALLPPNTYQWISAEPGEHTLMLNIASGEQEGLSPGSFKNASHLKLNVEPGNSYFFRANLRFGFTKSQLNMVQVGDKEGRQSISASRLAPAPAAKSAADSTAKP